MYMCFMDLEKAVDRVLRNVLEWAMKKKGMPEILVSSVMGFVCGSILSCPRSLRLKWG